MSQEHGVDGAGDVRGCCFVDKEVLSVLKMMPCAMNNVGGGTGGDTPCDTVNANSTFHNTM